MTSSGSWSPHGQPIPRRLRAPWEEPSTASGAVIRSRTERGQLGLQVRRHAVPVRITKRIENGQTGLRGAPSSQVSLTLIEAMREGSTVAGLSSSMTRSAYLPTVRLPIM